MKRPGAVPLTTATVNNTGTTMAVWNPSTTRWVIIPLTWEEVITRRADAWRLYRWERGRATYAVIRQRRGAK